MTWKEFIFSSKPGFRLRRHLMFWACYIVHEASSFIPISDFSELSTLFPYARALLITGIYLPVFAFSVYSFLYLLTDFLEQRFRKFAIGLLLAFICNYLLAIACTNVYAALMERDPAYHFTQLDIFTTAYHRGVGLGFVVTTLAVSLKLMKIWAVQEQRVRILAKLQMKTSLAMLKAQIYPDLILSGIDSLEKKINLPVGRSSEAILQLSDILSYVLYQTDKEFVLLEDELTAIRNQICLNKADSKTAPLVLLLDEGTDDSQLIPAMLLFLLVHRSYQLLLADGADEPSTLSIRLVSSMTQCKVDIRGSCSVAKGPSHPQWLQIIRFLEEKKDELSAFPMHYDCSWLQNSFHILLLSPIKTKTQ